MNENIRKINNDIKNLLFFLAVSIVIFFILLLLKTNVAICEWWTKNISRMWIWLVGHLVGWIGVSIFECFVVVAFIGIVIFLVIAIKSFVQKNGQNAVKILLILACFVVVFLNIYNISTGFAYNRAPLKIATYEGAITEEEVVAIARQYIDKLNEIASGLPKDENGSIICPYSTKELSDLLKEEYDKIDIEFSDYLHTYTPAAKSSMFSYFMSEMHIVGMFFAPTAEAHINTHCPSYDIACTMAHEMAHGKGVMREDDANFLAYYLTLNSENDFILFSGMYTLLWQLLEAVNYFPNSQPVYEELINSISFDVKLTGNSASVFWVEHDLLKDIEEFFNDAYLKSNGVENGTDSYQENNKADIVVDEENLDDYGEPIVQVVSFSNVQKLIFLFAKNAKFQ